MKDKTCGSCHFHKFIKGRLPNWCKEHQKNIKNINGVCDSWEKFDQKELQIKKEVLQDGNNVDRIKSE